MVCKRPLTHGKYRCQCPLIAEIRSFISMSMQGGEEMELGSK